ncbi:Glutamate--tRNA ligase mitochondrial [Neonectria punicea]|uniref:glutamate--tRNA ligase n=1 Tax=Neonectria punicea TaxID=979145 RepID=A0ABR1GR52_9HYPO
MIPPLARTPRLTRHLQLVQWLHPSILSVSRVHRRTFAVSVAQRQDEINNASQAPLKPRSQAKNPEKSETQFHKLSPGSDERGEAPGKTKPMSRLAALKQRSKSSDNATGDSAEAMQRYILGHPADKPIRTRFAPSPTGYLHLGSLRTALFNNLVSKATKGGQFIIRIEDTDQNRLVPDAEERIFKDLAWAGLSWDEGPDKQGPYGPYRQSERLETYHKHTKTLLDNGSAYRCFCSSDTLEAQKRALHDAGKPTAYPGTCRSIPHAESDLRAAAGEPHVVRLDSGRFGTPKFKDAIYGPFQKKEPEEDFVLMKTDGYPTYHLANVVDDHLMKITHVIRGEEWLISTPKHLALYEAFGWEAPTFAHLGLLISNDGSKLSKRNDSVNLSTYQGQNVFPIALQAWLANLGASFKRGHETPRTLDDVAEALTFKFTRGGIKLNPQKLDHFQWEYRNLLFQTPPERRTPLEQALIRDNLVSPLISEIQSITNDPASPPILPRGTSLPWPTPLTLVPVLLSLEPATAQAYALEILTHETTRYRSAVDIARLLPYFFWRPPPTVYRAALAAAPIRRALFDAIDTAVHESSAWAEALDRILEGVPAGDAPAIHSLLRLVAIGSFDAVGKTSRILFEVLGQEEWRVRTALVRSLLDELQQGGLELRQRWLDETSNVVQKE